MAKKHKERGVRVFRPKYRDRDGTLKKARRYYVDFCDPAGRRHRLPAFVDWRQSETFLRNIRELVASRRSGHAPNMHLQQWLEKLPRATLLKFIQWRMVDPERAEGARPIVQHLVDWRAHLIATGATTAHAGKQHDRTALVFRECGFRTLADIQRSKVDVAIAAIQKTVRQRREDDMVTVETGPISVSTRRKYAQACGQFTGWAVENGRMQSDPLYQKRGRGAKAGASDGQQRAALTQGEVAWLLDVTERGKRSYGLTGPERALLYRVAVETGFRSNELRSLRVGDFNWFTKKVRLPGRFTKNGRDADLPIRPALAEVLRKAFRQRTPEAEAFKMPHESSMARMLRKDLAAARAAWIEADPKNAPGRAESDFLRDVKDDGARIVFHSLRHSLGTMLAKQGVHPNTIKSVMRHSTITVTMDRYVHADADEDHAAIESLPSFEQTEQAERKATGTDGGR